MVLMTTPAVGYASLTVKTLTASPLWPVAIFLLTIILVIGKPRGLKIEFSAALGALLALATGVVKWQNIAEAWGLVWNGTLSLAALVVISLILDEAGVFRWLAFQLARLVIGRGQFLFCLVVLLGAVLTALLTNYSTVLVWTPTVMEMLLILGFSRNATLVFIMATSFIADASSLPLPISNLVNIITSDYFNTSFFRYALVMVPINFVTVFASLGVLWFYFESYISPTYNLTRLMPIYQGVIRDRLVFHGSFIILWLLLIGYFLAKPLGIPVSLVTWLGALAMLVLAGSGFHLSTKRAINLSKVLSEAPWPMILFSLGMSIVVIGLRNAGLTALVGHFLIYLSQWGITLSTVGTGFLAALLSSVMNNLPAVLINDIAIKDATDIDPVVREAMVYATIIGGDLGAKITPIGSLATLLGLNVLARKGFHVNLGQYVRVSIILTLPVLFVTLLSLAIWLPWLIA